MNITREYQMTIVEVCDAISQFSVFISWGFTLPSPPTEVNNLKQEIIIPT